MHRHRLTEGDEKEMKRRRAEQGRPRERPGPSSADEIRVARKELDRRSRYRSAWDLEEHTRLEGQTSCGERRGLRAAARGRHVSGHREQISGERRRGE